MWEHSVLTTCNYSSSWLVMTGIRNRVRTFPRTASSMTRWASNRWSQQTAESCFLGEPMENGREWQSLGSKHEGATMLFHKRPSS